MHWTEAMVRVGERDGAMRYTTCVVTHCIPIHYECMNCKRR